MDIVLSKSRPLISDKFAHNGHPVLAPVIQLLASWAATTRDLDLLWTPSDPKITDFANETPIHTVNANGATAGLGSMLVPEPLSPATRLSVRIYASIPAADVVATLRLGFEEGVRDVAITGAGWGGALSGWISTEIPCRGVRQGVPITLIGGTGTYGGGVVEIRALSVYWAVEPGAASVTAPSGGWDFVPTAKAAAPAGAAFSTVLSRSLARSANALTVGRPRGACQKWFSAYRNVPPTDGAGGYGILGRYKVPVGPRVSGLSFNALAKSNFAGGSIQVRVVGVGYAVQVANLTTGYAWRMGTISIPAGPAREVEVVVESTANNNSVASFALWEEQPAQADLCPAGESLPVAMPALPSAGSGSPIIASDLTTMIDALRYLAHERARQLVSDCRSVGVGIPSYGNNTDTIDGTDPNHVLGARYFRPTGNGSRRLLQTVAQGLRVGYTPTSAGVFLSANGGFGTTQYVPVSSANFPAVTWTALNPFTWLSTTQNLVLGSMTVGQQLGTYDAGVVCEEVA